MPPISLIEDPLRNHKQYKFCGLLGQGAFGFVVRASDLRSTPTKPLPDVAIKFLSRSNFTRYTESEILNHCTLRHPHVVQFKKLFLTDDYICIVMEYASGGSLFELVKKGKLPEDVARIFFQQLIIGMEYCHKRGVANRDMKLENALLHNMPGLPMPVLKICDFGYSKSMCRSAPKTKVGTLMYMAPEVLESDSFDQYCGQAADIWSCGVMLYTMLYGRYPFDQGPAVRNDPSALLEEMRTMRFLIPQGAEVSLECSDLLRLMLQPLPARRITLSQIMVHPWFLRNLPEKAARMNEAYLQQSQNENMEIVVSQIRRLLEQVRYGAASPSSDGWSDDTTINN